MGTLVNHPRSQAAGLLERSLTRELLPVRLLGVGATKLTRDPVVQADLFEERGHPQEAALDETIDTIRAQFVSAALGESAWTDAMAA